MENNAGNINNTDNSRHGEYDLTVMHEFNRKSSRLNALVVIASTLVFAGLGYYANSYSSINLEQRARARQMDLGKQSINDNYFANYGTNGVWGRANE